jgi:hypothetical protein
MEIRLVFTRNDKSLVSRAIMWFTQRRTHPERRCSHVFVKFNPCGIFGDNWLVFEAAEQGVHIAPYSVVLGKQKIVAEFVLTCSKDVAIDATIKSLDAYTYWYYDFVGVGLGALWILFSKCCGTPIRWFNLTFRPGKAKKALFCSGLARNVVMEVQKLDGKDYGVGGVSPREIEPRDLLDVCFSKPERYNPIPLSTGPK